VLSRSLEVAATINIPATVAWRLLTDTRAWPQWGPSVRAVEVPARFISAGMRGRVQTTLGFWLPFEITDWAAGSHWSWNVAGIPATGHLVEATGPDSCRVTFTIPAWAPFYIPVCRAALRAIGRLATRVEQCR
jgi:Polyketide cyclase / dehydrase and lipid transport